MDEMENAVTTAIGGAISTWCRSLASASCAMARRCTPPCSAGEIFGYAVVTHQYCNRYRLPVMHTETNLCQGASGDEAVASFT